MIAAALAALALAAPCHTTGTAPFTAPSNACTPGAFVRKTKADVCDGQTVRPSLPAAERRVILSNFGVPTFSGATGELDHRIPLVYGGTTDRRNVWPEAELAGYDPAKPKDNNPKDRLEGKILRRVCFGDPHPMRVTTAINVFRADWRPAFTYYVLGVGPRPAS